MVIKKLKAAITIKGAQTTIYKLPLKMRGEFIRQAVVCGVALSEVDTRLPAIISSLYRQGITGDELIALIKQVAGIFEKTPNEKKRSKH